MTRDEVFRSSSFRDLPIANVNDKVNDRLGPEFDGTLRDTSQLSEAEQLVSLGFIPIRVIVVRVDQDIDYRIEFGKLRDQ